MTIPEDCRYNNLKDTLAVARAQWQGMGIDTYGITIHRSSMYHPVEWPVTAPLRLTVRSGHASGDLPGFKSSILQSLTIDGLFDYIADEMAKHPDCLKASFDPTYGFPNLIYIDPEIAVTDEEVTFRVGDFGP